MPQRERHSRQPFDIALTFDAETGGPSQDIGDNWLKIAGCCADAREVVFKTRVVAERGLNGLRARLSIFTGFEDFASNLHINAFC